MLKRMAWGEVGPAGKIRMIRSVYREGISTTEIAILLGTTRAAVMTIYRRHRAALADCPLVNIGNRGASNGFSTWSQQDRDQIQELLKEGLSAADVAKRIGRTRGAVIGIVHRDPALKAIGFKGSNKDSEPTTKRKRRVRGGKVSKNRMEPDVITWVMGGAPSVGLPLSRLRPNQCRFAVNDAERGQEHLFCGAPADGSWCRHHRALVYRPSTKIDKRGMDLAA